MPQWRPILTPFQLLSVRPVASLRKPRGGEPANSAPKTLFLSIVSLRPREAAAALCSSSHFARTTRVSRNLRSRAKEISLILSSFSKHEAATSLKMSVLPQGPAKYRFRFVGALMIVTQFDKEIVNYINLILIIRMTASYYYCGRHWQLHRVTSLLRLLFVNNLVQYLNEKSRQDMPEVMTTRRSGGRDSRGRQKHSARRRPRVGRHSAATCARSKSNPRRARLRRCLDVLILSVGGVGVVIYVSGAFIAKVHVARLQRARESGADGRRRHRITCAQIGRPRDYLKSVTTKRNSHPFLLPTSSKIGLCFSPAPKSTGPVEKDSSSSFFRSR